MEARFTDEEEGPVTVIEAGEPFTAKQAQYLAFIYSVSMRRRLLPIRPPR
jgi:hypothetical protein